LRLYCKNLEFRTTDVAAALFAILHICLVLTCPLQFLSSAHERQFQYFAAHCRRLCRLRGNPVGPTLYRCAPVAGKEWVEAHPADVFCWGGIITKDTFDAIVGDGPKPPIPGDY
jgi:hypothetical protein